MTNIKGYDTIRITNKRRCTKWQTNRKTIGKMSNTRATWNINPVTKVKKDKTKYSRKNKHKGIDNYN